MHAICVAWRYLNYIIKERKIQWNSHFRFFRVAFLHKYTLQKNICFDDIYSKLNLLEKHRVRKKSKLLIRKKYFRFIREWEKEKVYPSNRVTLFISPAVFSKAISRNADFQLIVYLFKLVCPLFFVHSGKCRAREKRKNWNDCCVSVKLYAMAFSRKCTFHTVDATLTVKKTTWKSTYTWLYEKSKHVQISIFFIYVCWCSL